MDRGAVTVFAKNLQACRSDTAGTAFTKLQQDSLEDYFLGKVTYIPDPSTFRTVMSLSFVQKRHIQRAHLLNFNISFRNMVPDESAVFQFIQVGDLDVLIGLFIKGLASLSDCDTKGRSLLNVSST